MPSYPNPDALAAYGRIVTRLPGMNVKGKTMPYTSLNGHMTSFLDREGGLNLRLSVPDMTAFLQAWPGEAVISYGAVMKGYVAVPPALMAREDELVGWFEKSLAYIGGLKPKPTRGRK